MKNTNDNNLILFLEESKLNVVKIYKNLHLDETKIKILKETKNLSGVYLIFNTITSDYYIGSASTNKFYARFSNHLIHFKGSKVVKNAVRKYKLSHFAFLILELFPEIVNKENNKNLLNMEDFYLKYLLPNYNILTEAGSSFGYKHIEINRLNIKTNYTSVPHTSVSWENDKVIYTNKELLAMKDKFNPIILYNLNRTVFGEFLSVAEAAKSINCEIKTIERALKTRKKILKRRFIVEFKNNQK